MTAPQETKTFKVVLSTYSDSADQLRVKLKKFYRRRAESVLEPEPDRLKVKMRNGTELFCKIGRNGQGGKFSTEPIAEILITTTRSYLDYSLRAAEEQARKAGFSIRIDMHEEKPKTQTSV